MERKLKELEKRIEKLERLGMDEQEFIGMFQEIEACSCFEELEDLAKRLHAMKLPKVETFMMALALRIRQNTIVTKALDEALFELREELLPKNDTWQ